MAWLVVGSGALADVVELKDASTISGKVLAEKADSVVVDVGYTVLVVPRSAVAKVVTGDSAATATNSVAPTSPGEATPRVAPTTTESVGQAGFCQVGNGRVATAAFASW